ncbi:putative bifunctional diguanylate cyclase/phosphodiesterase [Chelativorans sp. YIM 93263]|uniref:putative bifunctional diguanylate cyclase/phosphodiesterase n=1 Tax=Chelativorans sp. YIM 93263 TaxID=2906648 RepID=UPI0023798316|nr:EAL domain-containing protein [Chelativorans sp. YIM 93263]
MRLLKLVRFSSFTSRFVIPVVVCVVAVSVAIAALVLWASREADSVAMERQSRLVRLVVSQLRTTIAHNQESVTVWDDAVLAVQEDRGEEWLDYNVGSWMYDYFGHNGAYVLGPDDKLIFGFATDAGAGEGESSFAAISGQVAPLVERLRQTMRAGDTDDLEDRMLSPGEADLTVVRGHPAVVSVKPFVSDTGNLEQTPGEEFLHVAVRYLDGEFVRELERDYLFEGMRFAWSDNSREGEASLPLLAGSGNIIGYFIWQPYRPGLAMLSKLVPVLLGALGLVLVALSILLTVLHRRSKKLHQSEARMKYLAHHDPLTGLPNRALFNERLDRSFLSRRSREMIAVLYLDLDRFKQVNDTLGHPAGDLLIMEIGNRLRELLRSVDTVARIGGDEFIITLPRLREVKEVEAICERIIEAVRKPFVIHEQQVFASVSIGVALAPQHSSERTELTRKADIALYHAKNHGRNGYAIFCTDMDTIVQERRRIEHDLRKALTRSNEIQVHYQPLYNASDMRITGAEALVRWKHPTKGWIAPNGFIPVAEEAGLIETLGQRVLREVCAAASAWPDQMVAVNISALELRNPSFVRRVLDTLDSYGIEPGRLEVEVTESALSGNADQCEKNVNALREEGIRVVLDDFGTGFSSFSRLQKLEVDRIKIDRCFVSGIGRVAGDEAIVQAIVDLAHAKGLKTTAEGVETEEQGDYLKRIGCDDLQGFLYSRPVTLKQFDGLLGVERPANSSEVSAA